MAANLPDLGALSAPGARVLLIGNAHHADPALNVDSITATVSELRATLIDTCGVDPERIRTLIDPADPIELDDAISASAKQATDLFLLYYIGHGQIGVDRELYLAARSTDSDTARLRTRALAYRVVREVLTSGTGARHRLVVLDCCFASRAASKPIAAAANAFDLAVVDGAYLMAASASNEEAHAPVGARFTAFSGELIDILRNGDVPSPATLTVDDLYKCLDRRLPAEQIPAPRRYASGRIGELIIANNPAAHEPTPSADPHARNEISTSIAGCPYRGLEPFDSVDARFYFGRKGETEQLIALMRQESSQSRLWVVVGNSGVGKSSLLHAGVLPRVLRGELRDGRTWWPMLCTPTEHPITMLAGRLAAPLKDSVERLCERLIEAPSSVAADIAQANRPHGLGVLLLVDQFEQLFSDCSDEQERVQFVRAINAFGESGWQVVLAVRADFYNRCLSYPELTAALTHRQVVVPPMTPIQLREIIEAPAREAGLEFESGLVDRLVLDAADDADFAAAGLPLLSYALLELWRRRAGSLMTLGGYEKTGGIGHAVTREANHAYDSLDSAGQRAMRELLVRMVHISEDTEITRYSIDVEDLIHAHPQDSAAIAAARDALAARRLIVLDGNTARISHDALLRAWPRLQGWIDEDRAGLLARQQLSIRAREWDRRDRDRAELYRGTKLANAREQWPDPHYDRTLGALEKAFLIESTKAERLKRALAVAAAIVLVLIVFSGTLTALNYASEHQHANEQASRRLAAAADSLRESDPATALQLSLVAFRTSPTAEAAASIRSAGMVRYPVVLAQNQASLVRHVSIATNQHLMVTGEGGDVIRLWDIHDPWRPRAGAVLDVKHLTNKTPHITGAQQDNLQSVKFIPFTEKIVVVMEEAIAIWDVHDPSKPEQMSYVRIESPAQTPEIDAMQAVVGAWQRVFGTRPTLALSADGHVLAFRVWPYDSIAIWNIADASHPVPMTTLPLEYNGRRVDISTMFYQPAPVALSPDGSKVAIGFNDAIKLWRIDNGPPTAVSEWKDPVALITTVTFGPRGDMVVAAGMRAWLAVYDIAEDPAQSKVRCSTARPTDDQDHRQIIEIDDSENNLLLLRDSGTVERFRLCSENERTSEVSSSTRIPDSLQVADASGGGRLIANNGTDGALRLWMPPWPVAIPATESDDGQSWLRMSDDSRVLQAGQQLWDISHPDSPTPGARLNQPTSGGSSFIPHTHVVLAEATQPDGTAGTGLWDVTDTAHPRLLATIPNVGAARISPDSHVLVVQSKNRSDYDVWDISRPEKPAAIGTITSLELPLAAGRLLCTKNAKGLQLWYLDKQGKITQGADIPIDPDWFRLSLDGSILIVKKNAKSPSVNIIQQPTSVFDTSDPKAPRKIDATGLDRLDDPEFGRGFLASAIASVESGTMNRIPGNSTVIHLW